MLRGKFQIQHRNLSLTVQEVYVPHQLLFAAVLERAGYARNVQGWAVFVDQRVVLHDRSFVLERRIPDYHAVVVLPEREVHALGGCR